jgi:YD repeat-containing protein
MNTIMRISVNVSVTSLFCCVLFLCTPGYVYGQQTPGNPVASDFKKVPTPPSPSAAALGKFGDIPVSASTGVPSISIPMYSYEDNEKGLNLDVSLKYHAGGHKVEDMASNVGLGWALNAGGVIMRTMKGLPDDLNNGYIRTPPLPLFNTTNFDSRLDEPYAGTPSGVGVCLDNNPLSFHTIKNIAENVYDGEADMFTLSVGNINEKFFLDKAGYVISSSLTNLIIRPTSPGNYSSFTVTDARGVRYIFDILEYMFSDNPIEQTIPVPPTYISSWYLSKIVSADGKDEIVFSYENTPSLSYESGLTIAYKTPHKVQGGVELPVYSESTITNSFNTNYTSEAKRIKKIVLPDKTTVDFDYTYARLDYVGDKALTSVKVLGNQYEKVFRMNYGYFLSECSTGICTPVGSQNDWTRRLKLLSVREESGSVVLPPYSFEYNSAALPLRNSKTQDWWGYYNGGATGDVIPPPPMNYLPGSSFLGRDLVPSLIHCKAAILERITYPTGGNTFFTYELNEGVSNGVIKPIGGLRVQKKEDYDPVTNATYTTQYTYVKPDNATSGVLITIPAYTAYWNTMWKIASNGDIAYAIKTYYFNESLNPTQTLSYFNGSPVVYTRVKEEQFVSGKSNGYKIFEFTPGETDLMHDNIYPFVQKQDLTWTRGLPSKTAIYNSSNELLSSEENEYRTTSVAPLMSEAATRNLVVGNYFWDDQGTLNKYIYGARYYYLERGISQLIKTTKTQKVGDNLIQDVIEYDYDNIHYLPILTKTTDTKGRTIEIKNYYPFHYNTTIYPLMGELVLKNRVAETISTEEWVTENASPSVRSIVVNGYATVNTNILAKTKTSSLKENRLVPQAEIGVFNPDVMYRSALIEEDMTVEKFDARGRGAQFKYRGGEKQSLIWGDHNRFPIASAVNAAFDDIAFTSFETVEKGNWEFTGAPSPDATAPTGSKVYAIAAGISKNISPGKEYILSLWRKGSVTVSNSTALGVGKTVGEWTYQEYLVTNTATLSIGGTGYVDEVRLYPKGAQMKSYTFQVSANPTSISDANGKLSYYEYDALGRLMVIKDSDRNIVKNLYYHYQER